MKKAPPEPASPDASPVKSALEDLDYTRHMLRELTARYTANLEGDIARIRALIEDHGKKPSSALLRDLRDIIGLLRRLDIKPEKGRRKDLKKLELTVRAVLDVAESW